MTELRELPEPPVPADTELRDLDGFMLNVERLLASELWALSSGDEFKAAVGLWCRAWKQVPAGSLPNDDKVLAAFSGAGKAWPKVKKVALRGFVLCSDGRLYHLVLCEDVERAAERKAEHMADREADRERLRKWREAKREKRRSGNAGETRFETDVKRVSKRSGNAHGNADETSNTGQGQGQGHYSDPNGSDATPSLGTLAPADGDWSRLLFRQGLAYLAAATGKEPNAKRALIGKWLKACGDNHKRVFDLLAEAQRRAVADPEAWVTKALDQRAADPKAALPFPGYVPMHPGAGG